MRHTGRSEALLGEIWKVVPQGSPLRCPPKRSHPSPRALLPPHLGLAEMATALGLSFLPREAALCGNTRRCSKDKTPENAHGSPEEGGTTFPNRCRAPSLSLKSQESRKAESKLMKRLASGPSPSLLASHSLSTILNTKFKHVRVCPLS